MSRTIRSFQDFRDSLPADRHCPLHGAVTRFHMCKATHPNICGDIGVARSAWMGPPSWVPPIKRRAAP